jgi:hypothetical protein
MHKVMTVNYIYNKTGLDKGECSDENLHKAKAMVPKALEKYVERKSNNLFRM